MSQSEQRNVVIALTIGLLVCIGCMTFLFLRPDRDSSFVEQNATVPQDAVGDEDLLALKSPRPQPPSESKSTQQSRSESLTEISDSFDSKHTVLSVVDQATEDKLVGMFIESLENPMVFESVKATYWMQSVVLTKLVNEDINKTKSLLNRLSERSAETVLYGVMCEWNRVHADEAVRLLETLEGSLQEQGFRGLVDGGNVLSRSKLLEIGKTIGLDEKFVSNLLDGQQTAQVQVSWKELEQEFETVDFADSVDLWHLPETAANYILATGLDALPEVLSLFDKLSEQRMSDIDRLNMKVIRTRVVSYISKHDPEAVFEFVAPLAKGADVDLLSAAAQAWFAVDPNALWNRLNESDLRGVQHTVTQDIIRHWSWREPDIVLISLQTLPAKYHDQAYLDIAQSMWYDTPFKALKLLPLISDWSTPQHLEVFGRSSSKTFSIEQVISNAAEAAPAATIEWINSDESQLHDSVRTKYLVDVFESWSQTDPEKAFEMALKMPLREDEKGLEATVLQSLVHHELDRAITLLPRVREGETKAFAIERISWEMEAQDRIAEAIQLGEDLPLLERKKFHQSIASRVGFRTPFDRLVSGIQQLPTLEMKSKAASTAIHTKGLPMSNDLSESQINELKQFLTDDDRRRVEIILEFDKDDSKE